MKLKHMSNIEKLNNRLQEIKCEVFICSEIKTDTGFILSFSTGYKIEEKKRNRNISRMILYSITFPNYANELLSNDELIRKDVLAARKKAIASNGGKVAMQNVNNHVRKKMPPDYTSWNDGLSGLTGWSKGLTKEVDDRLVNVSNSKLGEKNGMYGKKLSDLHKEKYQ